MTAFPFGETITRLRSQPRDKYGDVPDVPDEATISNVGIDWDSTSENTDSRETTTSDVTLYVPKGADIVASDRVRLADGSTWRVVGRPMWGGVHPMTGHDFGVKTVKIRES